MNIPKIDLPYLPPYDWSAMLNFLSARAIPGVERVENGEYMRTVKIGETMSAVDVQHLPEESFLLFSLPPLFIAEEGALLQMEERFASLFDLKIDPQKVQDHLANDEQLAASVRKRPGLRVPGAWDGFEIAVRAILGQQVSVKAATTISGRIVQRFGEELSVEYGAFDLQLTHLFPTAEVLCDADLSGLGLTGQRQKAIRGLAQAVVDGYIDWEDERPLPELIRHLTKLPGIGEWTANYIAMRVFRRADAFLAGDLVLRKVVGGGAAETVSAKQLAQMAEPWRPYRAYAAMYLWASSQD